MSQCLNNTAVIGCYKDGTNPPQSVVIHYAYDNEGQPAVHITDLAGVVVADATVANTSLGACIVPSPDVEWETLCDVQVDGSSVQFIRRSITSFDGLGNPTTVVADFAPDQITPYTVTGTVGACPACPELSARGLQTAW